MPRNSSGIYSPPTGNPVIPNTLITSDWANDLVTDVGNELTKSVAQTSGTGSAIIPAGNNAQRDPSPKVGAIRFTSTDFGWEGWNGVNWVSIGGGQMLGQSFAKAIFYNSQTIAENLSIAAGTNAMSAGPITINDGYAVTISDGSTWSIV